MRSIHVDVVGGGPGGLFLARLLKLADPSMVVRVYERNGPATASGFGLVFSDRTIASLRAADPETYQLLQRACVNWSDMEIRLPGTVLRYGGYGFTAIPRHALLRILQRQATRAGAELNFHHEYPVPPPAPPDRGQAAVVIADGAGSANRDRYSDRFGTTIDTGTTRYIWFGTDARFDAVTFPFVATEYGAFAAHAYPFAPGRSTFIVEVDEATWRNAGMAGSAAAAARSGRTDRYAQHLLTEVFADHLGGRQLIDNRSRWARFRVVRNRHWSAGHLVLLGDAAHTAHFSVGSGTKLAMADAIALAAALVEADRLPDAFAAYEAARRPLVARTQELAERSRRWWESFGQRLHLPPHRFGVHFLTRTWAISYAGLRRRHPERIAEAEAELARLTRGAAPAGQAPANRAPTDRTPTDGALADDALADDALAWPVALGPLRLRSRVAVRLPGPAYRLPGLAAACAGSCGLVLVDLRGQPPAATARLATSWSGPAKRLSDLGVALGLMLESAAATGAGEAAVRASGAHLLVVTVDLSSGSWTGRPAVSVPVAGTVPVAVAAGCPSEPAWSSLGDRVVDGCRRLLQRGVAGLYLAGAGTAWQCRLDWADRVRTEAGLSVLLDGPDGWAVRGSADGSEPGDDWPSRLHPVVVSGRADLIVTQPPPREPGTVTRLPHHG